MVDKPNVPVDNSNDKCENQTSTLTILSTNVLKKKCDIMLIAKNFAVDNFVDKRGQSFDNIYRVVESSHLC